MPEFLKLKKKPLHLQDLPKSELHKGQSEEREHTTNPRIATQIASDHLHEDKKYYTHLEHMDKQAFERGFLKTAIANDIDPLTAVQLLKLADSSFLGRYLAQKASMGNAAIDYPGRSFAGMAPGLVGSEVANAVAPGAGLLGSPIAEMGQAASYGGDEGRKEKYKKSTKEVENRSTLSNMHHGGKQIGGLYGALGGLAGAGLGAYKGIKDGEGDPTMALFHALRGAGIGSAAGLGAGYVGGGIGGGINSAITKNTSKETKDRAIEMKAKHPYLTALPFGDFVGAGMS